MLVHSPWPLSSSSPISMSATIQNGPTLAHQDIMSFAGMCSTVEVSDHVMACFGRLTAAEKVRALGELHGRIAPPTVAMVPQACQQQAQAMSVREVAAARVSIARLRSKAEAASNPVDAGHLNAAADRTSGDLVYTAAPAVSSSWIERSATRRDLIGTDGAIIGSVVRLYCRWQADFVPTSARSRTTRTVIGAFVTEAEARAAVERNTRGPARIVIVLAERLSGRPNCDLYRTLVDFADQRRGRAA